MNGNVDNTINYLNGDDFLANVFFELIRRKKLEITMEGLIKTEFYYMSLIGNERSILLNSVNNILGFIKAHEEFLEIENKKDEIKILISNEEDFKDVLHYEFDQNFNKKYKKAVKMLINEERKFA